MRALIAVVLVAMSGHAMAATFLVDNGADIPDAIPGDGKCSFLPDPPLTGGVCTLRAAIMEANATVAHDTIQLAAGATYLLTRAGQDENIAVTGDLDIRNPVTIQPPTFFGIPTGMATIDANGLDRVFQILNVQGAGVTLKGLKIRGGVLSGDGPNRGTGIIVNNSKVDLSFLDASSIQGSVISADNSNADVTIQHSTITGTHHHAAVRLSFSANIMIDSSSLMGGAVGLFVSENSKAILNNSTISGNSEMGITVNFDGEAQVSYSTIADNGLYGINVIDGTISVMGTVFAGNNKSCNHFDSNSLDMNGNIYDDESCPYGGVVDGSLFNQTVYLSLLGDHGGFTPTHRPMINSPALDAITGPACSDDDYDQRLMPRAVAFKGGQAACDIGAVELETDVIFFDQVDRL